MRLSVSGDRARSDLLTQQLEGKRNELVKLNTEAELATQVRLLFESLTDKKRELVRTKIEALVTHGIQAVFGPSYIFKIEQEIKRNNVTFNYRIHHEFKGELKESDLRGFHGGGLVALVGFLLRVVMVLFTHPPRRRIIFLDETMAALDGDKRQPFAHLLKQLAAQLSMQFIVITHSPEYASDADKVYLVTPTGDGISKLVLQD